MLPEWKWREPWWGEWPDCAVADGNAVGNMLEQVRDEGATPRWVVVDGGALSKGTVEAMKAAGLRMWAVRMSVSVWGTDLPTDHAPRQHATTEVLARRLDSAVRGKVDVEEVNDRRGGVEKVPRQEARKRMGNGGDGGKGPARKKEEVCGEGSAEGGTRK